MSKPDEKLASINAGTIPLILRYIGLILVVPATIFIALADEVYAGKTLFFDNYILNSLHAVSNPVVDSVILRITNLGGFMFLLIATSLIVLGLLYIKSLYRAAMVLTVVVGAGVINYWLKLVFLRERPSLWVSLVTENTYSFPSGHAMGSSALALSIVLVCWNTRWRNLAIILGTLYVVVIGITRVYLGVHFPSDIVAGWCVSLLWGVGIYNVFSRISHKLKTS